MISAQDSAPQQPGRSLDTDTIISEHAPASKESVPEATNRRTVWQTIKLMIVIFALVLTMFTISLNSTVVAPAMSIIATELDALEQQTWIATSYMVAMNAFQPLSGKFSDIFGRKPVLMFGMALFLIASIVNATTRNIQGLIAGRTIQGFGAGGMMSMLYVIITDIAPIDWRPRLQSMLAVVYGLASVVGPLIGGAFVDYLSWRWDFWLNLILSGTGFVLALCFLRETAPVQKSSFLTKVKRIDVLGTVFSIGLICCLLLALSWGPLYGWGSGHAIGAFVAAGVSLILLVISEGWIAKEPIIPAQVVLNPSILIFYLYLCCLGLGFVGTLYFGPILFQAVFGADSTQSGIRLIPFMACLIAGSLGGGLLLRYFNYIKVYILVAAASNLLGYGLFFTVNETSSWGRQAGFLTFCGLAFGLSQQNSILGVQSVAKKENMAVATSLCNFFMLLASSIGVAIYQTLYSTFLEAQYKGLDPEVLAIANEYGALGNYLYIRNLPSDVQQPVIKAYMHALHNVFIAPIVASGFGVICAIFIRNVRYGMPVNHDAEKANEDKLELQQLPSLHDSISVRIP